MTSPEASGSARRTLAGRMPLRGSRLIEASAGTGKTYTIEALYVRLVLGHGDAGTAHPRPLDPPEILVVTFTNAAARELRERIRRRLVQAATVFRGAGTGADAMLLELQADYPSADERAACARRLEVAAQWMDEAAIHTIHAWCMGVLRRFAFASNTLFRMEVTTDDQAVFEEVVLDYWRRTCYRDDPALCGALRRTWKTFEAFRNDVRAVLGAEPVNAPAGLSEDPFAPWQDWARAAAPLRATMARLWMEHRIEVLERLKAAIGAKALNGKSYRLDGLAAWARELDQWLATPAFAPPGKLSRLGARELANRTNKGGQTPSHPFFDAVDAFLDHHGREPALDVSVLLDARGRIRADFDRRREQLGLLNMDDLPRRLAEALSGDGGPELAETLRRQYPVAMIDEFQDTDPVQYRIFDRIYTIGEGDTDHALLMIGDPKQAIYGFRGADIHSYLRARNATAGRHETLDTNYRSTVAMVQAVNTLFGRAEAQTGAAFAMTGEHHIPFQSVAASGRPEHLEVDGQAVAAMTLWQLSGEMPGKPVNKTRYQQEMAGRAATAIARLIEAGRAGRAGFVTDNGARRPLEARDMAVLVHTGHEARAVREELLARGVRSVYLSDRDSVFATAEAADVERWLAAVAEPRSERLLRAALGTPTLGLTMEELGLLCGDDRLWEAELERFAELLQVWRRRGVQAVIRRLLHDFHAPARLRRVNDPERVLTNVLHLAELLQTESVQLDGEQALLRWLRMQRQSDETAPEAAVLRLESDADLLRVVTVHKSKGLEYPLVFLPLACQYRPADAGKLDHHIHYHDGRRVLDLTRGDEARRRHQREALQEQLRLMYVALTRARHCCWLGVTLLGHGNGAQPVLAETAMGHLLAGGAELTDESLGAALQSLADQSGGTIRVEPAPEVAGLEVTPAVPAAEPGPARTFTAGMGPRWWVASYSALRVGGEMAQESGAAVESPDTAAESTLAEELGPAPAVPGVARRGIHALPMGADAGTFVHGLLELAAQPGFGATLAEPDGFLRQVRLRCQRRGWGEHAQAYGRWMLDALAASVPLPDGQHVRLADLAPGACRPELEFWFAADGVSIAALDAEVRAATLGGRRRPALEPGTLNGMLKGFIDLVFETGGRYYLMDYKSNVLGTDDTAYRPDALAEAMTAKRYDVQMVLYVLALHRLLRTRLPDYDYDRHMGGAVYWFVRGLGGPHAGVLGERLPRALVDALDRLFEGGVGVDHAA